VVIHCVAGSAYNDTDTSVDGVHSQEGATPGRACKTGAQSHVDEQ